MERSKNIHFLFILILFSSIIITLQAKQDSNNLEIKTKTMLEQFYEYIQGERDAMEKRLENKRFHLGNVIMKIPKKSDKSRIKRSNQNKDYHVNKIKEEIEKLKDLIMILNDQKTVIDGLNHLDSTKNLNFTIFPKELNDLKHYVKVVLVDKLEKEIVDRKNVDKEFLNELENQKEIVEKIQNRNNQKMEKDDVINDIFNELKSLETHLGSLRNKKVVDENILRSSDKMRKSNLEQLLENDEDDINQSKLLKKLVKIIENENKKKKEKSVLDVLFGKINENTKKLENREENIDLEDRLKELQEEIDGLQPNTDDIESKKLDDFIKKLFVNQKKLIPEKIIKKESNLENLITKLLQKLNQKSKHDEKKFNLYDCKHVQPLNNDFNPNFGFNFDNYHNSNLNYHNSNLNYHNSNLNYPNNINYQNPNLNYQNFNENELFQDPYQSNFNQQSINKYNTQENQGYSPKNWIDNKNNVTKIDNKQDFNQDDDVLKSKSKRSLSLEENLVEILKDELKNEDENENLIKNSNENELESQEILDENFENQDNNQENNQKNSKERSFYGHKKSFQSKKVTIFDKLFDKILNKVVDKAQVAIPKIIKAFFDVKTIFGIDLNNNYDVLNNNNQYGLGNFKNFGLLGILPIFIIKLVAMFNSFMYQLQQFPFFKNFLVPGLTLLAVSGMIVFLIWWLQPNYNNYNNFRGYSNNYYDYNYQKNYQTATPGYNYYNQYKKYPNFNYNNPNFNNYNPNFNNNNNNVYKYSK